jgi:hypothetical protein
MTEHKWSPWTYEHERDADGSWWTRERRCSCGQHVRESVIACCRPFRSDRFCPRQRQETLDRLWSERAARAVDEALGQVADHLHYAGR